LIIKPRAHSQGSRSKGNVELSIKKKMRREKISPALKFSTPASPVFLQTPLRIVIGTNHFQEAVPTTPVQCKAPGGGDCDLVAGSLIGETRTAKL
jgi:hypothetical protein